MARGLSGLASHAQLNPGAQATGTFSRFQLIKPEPSADSLMLDNLQEGRRTSFVDPSLANRVTARTQMLVKPEYDSSDRSSSPAPMASSSKVQLNGPLPDPLQAALRNDPLLNAMNRLAGDLLGPADDSDDERFDIDGNFFGRGRDKFRGPVANPGEFVHSSRQSYAQLNVVFSL